MHNLANTGRGLSGGAADADGSPYATGTSVLMGWALSAEASLSSNAAASNVGDEGGGAAGKCGQLTNGPKPQKRQSCPWPPAVQPSPP